jgi:NAD(P)H dehydrogenase (quinone)
VRVLVIAAFDDADSFSDTLLQRALASLDAAAHEVRSLQLGHGRFGEFMTAAEHAAYQTDTPILSDDVRISAADLSWAQALVFIYPTGWAGMPAVLKGWLERVMVPGVAFVLDERSGKVRANLGYVTRIVGITHTSLRRQQFWLTGDGGRRTLLRALRMICSRWTRSKWIAIYSIGGATAAEREAFLRRVDQIGRHLS